MVVDQSRILSRLLSNVNDELQIFRRYLLWMCVDQSTWPSAALSWLVFSIFALAVPALSYFALACPACDAEHGRPYDQVVQLSLTSLSTLSFVFLSFFVRKYGLRRFLFLDKLVNESAAVKQDYTEHLNRSLWICSVFVAPCFAAECAYKIWWYTSGASRIPFLGNALVSDIVACTFELLSWLYRTAIFFLLCVLFRLICYLQIIRQKEFAKFFLEDSCDVASVLAGHLRLRRHLKIISFRFRWYILCLALVTVSQFASLLAVTKSDADANIVRAGELAICSVTLVTGLMIILRSATKITHKAQAITSLAVMWHVCATIDSYDSTEPESTPVLIQQMNDAVDMYSRHHANVESDGEDPGEDEDEDELDNTTLITGYAYNSISYQKRQALVTYFEHHRTGIRLHGFLIDRIWLQLIFGIELSLVLWLLGKTIGI